MHTIYLSALVLVASAQHGKALSSLYSATLSPLSLERADHFGYNVEENVSYDYTYQISYSYDQVMGDIHDFDYANYDWGPDYHTPDFYLSDSTSDSLV